MRSRLLITRGGWFCLVLPGFARFHCNETPPKTGFTVTRHPQRWLKTKTKDGSIHVERCGERVTGHFAPLTFRSLDLSPTHWTFHSLDISPLDVSSTGRFAYYSGRFALVSFQVALYVSSLR